MNRSTASEKVVSAFAATLILLALALLGVAASASAHSCSAEKGTAMQAECERPCTEGENHDHRVTHHHENAWKPDENHVHYSCSSSDGGDGGEKCSTPRILGMCIIDDDLDPTNRPISSEG